MIESTQTKLESVAEINRVGFALNLASVFKGNSTVAQVECFVVPVSERPMGNTRTSGRALQEVQVTVGIVIAIRSLNDVTGERGQDQLEQIRALVRDQLFGWTPDGASTHYLLGNGDLIKMEAGRIFWMDRYITKVQRQQRV